MSQAIPYTYYACACSGTTSFTLAQQARRHTVAADEETEQQTFDPTSPRANYSLYPLEKLLYCADCHELRCPRCITEEVACWYCPQCLFEAPSSNVRSEGNRCPRSCYNCPICTATLTVNPIEPRSNQERDISGPYILSCSWCNWSSLDIDLTFDKSTNITGQLQRWRAARQGDHASKDRQLSQAERILLRSEENSTPTTPVPTADGAKQIGSNLTRQANEIAPDAEDVFVSLNAFYKQQIAETSEGYVGLGASDYSFASPSSINRLLNLYNAAGKRAKKARPKEMREALSTDEGFRLFDPTTEEEALKKVHTEGVECLATGQQQRLQDKRYEARFRDDLLPVAALFRQKRVKRCRVCRQLLSRPEPKVTNTRYKFKLLALSHIPKVSLRPLQLQASLSASTSSTLRQPAMTIGSAVKPSVSSPIMLTSLTTNTFLLTVTNPIFEPLRVTLATPGTTPGPVQSRVTILCPQFEVGSNTDMWDEALTGPSSGSGGASRDGRRRGVLTSSTSGQEDQRVPEAGKVWDKGRNWTSVVVEIVPGILPGNPGYIGPKASAEGPQIPTKRVLDDEEDSESDEPYEDDEGTVLEIPIFARIEYEVEAGGEDGGSSAGTRTTSVAGALAGGGPLAGTTKDVKEKRELAFWCVLGAGYIAR